MTQQTDPVLTGKEGGSGAWAEIEPGAYRAQVQDIEDVGVSEMFPADGPRLKFTFALPDVLDDEGQPVTLFKWCSQKLSTGKMPSNLWKWAEAMGLAPVVDQPFAVSQLRGRECQIVVEMKAPKGGGDPRPNITNVLPVPKSSRPVGGKGKAPPLAERLGAAAPADGIEACVICGQPGAAYSAQGAALCEAHKAV